MPGQGMEVGISIRYKKEIGLNSMNSSYHKGICFPAKLYTEFLNCVKKSFSRDLGHRSDEVGYPISFNIDELNGLGNCYNMYYMFVNRGVIQQLDHLATVLDDKIAKIEVDAMVWRNMLYLASGCLYFDIVHEKRLSCNFDLRPYDNHLFRSGPTEDLEVYGKTCTKIKKLRCNCYDKSQFDYITNSLKWYWVYGAKLFYLLAMTHTSERELSFQNNLWHYSDLDQNDISDLAVKNCYSYSDSRVSCIFCNKITKLMFFYLQDFEDDRLISKFNILHFETCSSFEKESN